MKINRLETHDRLQHFVKDQTLNIFQGAEDCLKKNPLSLAIQEKSPYVYLFAHPRTADDGLNKVMYWQPRLSIPEPQDNSYLFRAISKSDLIEVCWMIPPREMWNQYKRGNVTEHQLVLLSIDKFIHNKKSLCEPHPDDLPELQTRFMLKQVVDEHRDSLKYAKPKILVGSSVA